MAWTKFILVYEALDRLIALRKYGHDLSINYLEAPPQTRRKVSNIRQFVRYIRIYKPKNVKIWLTNTHTQTTVLLLYWFLCCCSHQLFNNGICSKCWFLFGSNWNWSRAIDSSAFSSTHILTKYYLVEEYTYSTFTSVYRLYDRKSTFKKGTMPFDPRNVEHGINI